MIIKDQIQGFYRNSFSLHFFLLYKYRFGLIKGSEFCCSIILSTHHWVMGGLFIYFIFVFQIAGKSNKLANC